MFMKKYKAVQIWSSCVYDPVLNSITRDLEDKGIITDFSRQIILEKFERAKKTIESNPDIKYSEEAMKAFYF